jgi:hypothetical protein
MTSHEGARMKAAASLPGRTARKSSSPMSGFFTMAA